MATLELLAPELLLHIFTSCHTFRDLRSLISASPTCLRIFLGNRKYSILSFLKSSLGSRNYCEILAISHVPSLVPGGHNDSLLPLPRDRQRLGDNTTQAINTMKPYLDYYFSTRPFENPCDGTDMAAICRLHDNVCRLVDLYFLDTSEFLMACSSSSTTSESSATTPVAPLSITERSRLQRAFLRYELYSRVFPYDQHFQSLVSANGQFHLFIRRMEPWEVEELSCVHQYLTSLTAGYLKSLQNLFVDDFLSCPGVVQRPLQPQAVGICNGDDSSDGHPPPFQSPQPDFAPAKVNEVEPKQERMIGVPNRDIYPTGLLSSFFFEQYLPGWATDLTLFGLEFFLQLLDASDHPRLQRALIISKDPQSFTYRDFLPEALWYSPIIQADNAGAREYSSSMYHWTLRYPSIASESNCTWDREQEPEANEKEENPTRPNHGYRGYGRDRHKVGSQRPVYGQIYNPLNPQAEDDELFRYDPLWEIGYVFWDKGRLEAGNAQENLRRADSNLRSEEDEQRQKK